jgi:hypothetical protein
MLWAGEPGHRSWQRKIFLLATASKLALDPNQPPTQWLLGARSLAVKWQEHEADYSLQSSAKIKNGGAIPPLPG